MPEMMMPKKLLPLVQKQKRFKVILGGRGSGKSQTVADICLMDMQTKGIKLGCFREFQNSIDDSVKSLLAEEIDRMKLQGFDVLDNRIDYQGLTCAKFKGLARNTESMKSMHGYTRFFVEEAQTISYKSLKTLTPTLRTEGSECWFVGNPQSAADPFSERFINPYKKQLDKYGYYEDDLHLIIVCNYMDNPFFPKVLEEERQHDYETLDRAEYDHIWLGEFNDSVDRAIIKKAWFDAAIDAHLRKAGGWKPRGAIIAAHDPSDEGADSKGIAIRHGSVFIDVQENDYDDVNDGCDWATDIAIEHRADLFVWDCDGLGTTLKRQVAANFKGKKCALKMYKGSKSVDEPDEIYDEIDSIKEPKTNKQTFRNKRAQYYTKLADRFYNTYRSVVKGEYIDPDDQISLSSDIEDMAQLRSEICRIPLKPNGSGLIQIMSKEEMKSKYQIPSPNMADCLAMAMEIPEPLKKEWAPINYPAQAVV